MIREEPQDREQHASGEELASEDFLARVLAETKPSFASVLSSPSGLYFFWRCGRCLRSGDVSPYKERAQARADAHNAAVHS